MIIFVLPDGTVGLASSREEAIRRFRGFIEGEEIAPPDSPNSDSVVPTPVISTSASDSGFNSDSDSWLRIFKDDFKVVLFYSLKTSTGFFYLPDSLQIFLHPF